ncbi:MAG TPA: hypothetical protein VHD56_12565 [Tepidisphaeraceae bacterium]|nr:hypothetical protein [Tepidisphaeraceae bacterium]
MAAILIKNVPEKLKNRIKKDAVKNRRSMNQQILMLLEKATLTVPPVRLPKPIKPLKPITAEMILDAIHKGRE